MPCWNEWVTSSPISRAPRSKRSEVCPFHQLSASTSSPEDDFSENQCLGSSSGFRPSFLKFWAGLDDRLLLLELLRPYQSPKARD